MIELSKINTLGGTQPRAELNQETIAEYRDAYKAGATFPPVTLFFDGATYWLADGFHRFWGAKEAGKTTILEEITPGTQREAILYSLGANSKHGLKRSNADKRKAVKTLLDDAEWSQWSSNEIARRCAVGRDLVETLKNSHHAETHDSRPEKQTVQRNGKTYEQKKKAGSDKPNGKPKLLTEEMSEKVLAAAEKAKAEAAKAKAEAEALKAENVRLAESAELLAKDSRETLSDNESMAKIFDADDKLAAATKENDRLRAEVRSLRESLNGKMNECNEINKLLRFWKNKAERLEKAAA